MTQYYMARGSILNVLRFSIKRPKVVTRLKDDDLIFDPEGCLSNIHGDCLGALFPNIPLKEPGMTKVEVTEMDGGYFIRRMDSNRKENR